MQYIIVCFFKHIEFLKMLQDDVSIFFLRCFRPLRNSTALRLAALITHASYKLKRSKKGCLVWRQALWVRRSLECALIIYNIHKIRCTFLVPLRTRRSEMPKTLANSVSLVRRYACGSCLRQQDTFLNRAFRHISGMRFAASRTKQWISKRPRVKKKY